MLCRGPFLRQINFSTTLYQPSICVLTPYRTYVKATPEEFLQRIKSSTSTNNLFGRLTHKNNLPILNIDHFRLGLHRLKKTKNSAKIEKVIEFMKTETDVEPDEKCYGFLLMAYHSNKQYHEIVNTVEHIEEENIRNNIFIRVQYMNALAKLGKYQDIEKEWNNILNEKIEFDINALHAVLEGYANAGKFAEATEFLQNMQSKYSIEPDVRSYTILISGYANHGLKDDAIRVLNEMKEKNIPPNQVTYSALIAGLSKTGNPELGFFWLEKMEEEGVKPPLPAFKSLISRFVQTKQYGYIIRMNRILERLEQEKALIFDKNTKNYLNSIISTSGVALNDIS